MNPREAYTEQRLGRIADLKIRARLFRIFLGRALGRSFSVPRVLAGALVVAVLVVAVVPRQVENYRLNSFIAQAEAAQLALDEQADKEIYHRKYMVREGAGKAAYVAKVKNIPITDAAQVPLRHDTIEEWRHGITNLSYIETDVLGRPIAVKLNLENEDHMHIFEYAPSNCTSQEKDEIKTQACAERAQVTETYKAHRTVFDEVHDIQSLYAREVAYTPEPAERIALSKLTYVGMETVNGREYRVFSSEKDGIETRYFFDTETHLLKKRVVAILSDGERYEMSEIEELAHTFLPAAEAPKVFNPKQYSYVQKEVIPLNTES